MTKLSKAQLISGGRLATDVVELVGGTVTVRELTRLEAAAIRDRTDTDARERLILASGMVDPEMTESEVTEWMRAGGQAEIAKVSMTIGRLSGLLEDSPKEAFPSDGGQPGPGAGVLPSAEVGDAPR